MAHAEPPAARYAARLAHPAGGTAWLLARHDGAEQYGAEAAALIRAVKPAKARAPRFEAVRHRV